MSLHPSEGARFLLERRAVSGGDEQADYDAAIYTPEERFAYQVVMHLDGSYQVEPADGGAGEALEKRLEMLVKLTARSASKRRDESLPPWPHRVLRWKGPGRG